MTRLDNDLISRKALLEAIRPKLTRLYGYEIRGIEELIANAPTAAQPPKNIIPSEGIEKLMADYVRPTPLPTLKLTYEQLNTPFGIEPIAPTVAQDSEPILYAVQGYKEALNLHNGATLCTEKQDDLHTLPLYTSPPKREWRGLSDEEISLMAFNDDEGDWNDLRFANCWIEGYLKGAKATIAKLKEANGYD